MRGLMRPALLITLLLLIPVVPFLWFGEALEARIGQWLDPPPSAGIIAVMTFGILAADIFLPVPSSLVSTAAGAELGIPLATMASWAGLSAGNVLGFAVARRFGRPLAFRFAKPADLEGLEMLSARFGPRLLVLTRALPVLAEAAVLLVGAMRLGWREFLPPILLSNLGLSLAYATLGRYAQAQGQLPLALAASIALPLLAATMARRLFEPVVR